jgi:hypothetical protein
MKCEECGRTATVTWDMPNKTHHFCYECAVEWAYMQPYRPSTGIMQKEETEEEQPNGE